MMKGDAGRESRFRAAQVPPLDLGNLPESRIHGAPRKSSDAPFAAPTPAPPAAAKPHDASPRVRSRSAYGGGAMRGSSAPGTRKEEYEAAGGFPSRGRSRLAPPKHHEVAPAAKRRSKVGGTLAERGINMRTAVKAVMQLQAETPRELPGSAACNASPNAKKFRGNIFRKVQDQEEPSPEEGPYTYEGNPEMEKLMKKYGSSGKFDKEIDLRKIPNVSPYVYGIEAMEPDFNATPLVHVHSSTARENTEISFARAVLSAQSTATRERFPPGMSAEAQEVWQRPLNVPVPVKLPGGSLNESAFESHLLDCFGLYRRVAVDDFQSVRDHRRRSNRSPGRQSSIGRGSPKWSRSLSRSPSRPATTERAKSRMEKTAAQYPEEMLQLMQKFPGAEPADILQLVADPSYCRAYGIDLEEASQVFQDSEESESESEGDDLLAGELQRISANTEMFKFNWVQRAGERWGHDKGIRFTQQEIRSLERAEKQTRERLSLAVQKQQFVNAIQDADAHQQVPDMPARGIPSRGSSARPGSALQGDFGSPRPQSGVPCGRSHTVSSPGRLSTASSMSKPQRPLSFATTVDMSPRNRIQGLVLNREQSSVGKSLQGSRTRTMDGVVPPEPPAPCPHGSMAAIPMRSHPMQSSRVMPKTTLTTENLISELSMEEVIPDVRIGTLDREESEGQRQMPGIETASPVGRPQKKAVKSSPPASAPPPLPLDAIAAQADARASKGLVLSHRCLGNEYIPAIVGCVRGCSFLTAIRVDSNNFDDVGIGALLITLRDLKGSQVTELDISNNKRLTWQAAKPLASLLADEKTHTKLNTLTMVGVDLGDKGVEILGPAVARSHPLRSLDIRRCSIGDIGAAKLSAMLHDNTELQVLRLAWNNIRAKGGKALAEMLRQHPALVGLDLSHNAIGDVGGSYIAHSLVMHRTMEWVDLSCNHLQVGSCMALSEVVRARMDSIRHCNTTPSKGGGDASNAERHDSVVPLRSLSIDGNEIGFLGGYWLLKGLVSADLGLTSEMNDGAATVNSDMTSTCEITMNRCGLFRSNTLDKGPGRSLNDTRMTATEARELDMPSDIKPKKGKDKKGDKKAAGLKAPRLYAKDARKLYASKDMKDWVCRDAEHFNPFFPQISYELDMDVPSNVQVWKELYRFSQEREELSLKSVKLGGKRLKEEDFAHYASLPSTSLTGVMSLNAVAPLVIPEDDTVVAPQVVVNFCLNHMKEPGTLDGAETPWMLELVRLLTSMFWFSSKQAYQLLQKFPKGTSESCSAALLLFGRCIDPLSFDPVAHVLDEENLASFRSKTGLLYHIDPRNLTGRYYLELEHPFEYIMALRLRDASLREGEYDRHPFLVNWRNVTLNGRPLSFAAPMALDSLIIPRSGILHLDYISQVEAPEGEAATDVMFGRLMNEVRRGYMKYNRDFHSAVVEASILRKAAQLKKHPSREAMDGEGSEKLKSKQNKLKTAFSAALKEDSRTHVGSILTRSNTKKMGGMQPLWWHKLPNVSILSLVQVLLPIQSAKYPVNKPVAPDSARGGTPRDATGAPSRRVLPGQASTPRGAQNDLGKSIDVTLEGLPLAWEPKVEGITGPPPGSKARGGARGGGRPGVDDGVGSAEFTDHERLVAFYTMSCRDEEELKILLVSMSDGTRRRVMQLLARLPGGIDICAAMLEAMPSSLASRHLIELIDYPELTLPPELHEQVVKAMHPDAITEAEQISRGIDACCSKRLERVRRAVLRWASSHNLTCTQLNRVLGALTFQRDRITAITALWTSITDRAEFVPCVVAKLSRAEQVMVYQRLGYHKLMTLTPRPYGVHFRLQLKTQEGRETAMRLCYLATSLYKARQKSQEGGKITNLLLNFYGDGRNLILTEDDKLWGMVEKYQILEFDVDVQQVNAKAEHVKRTLAAVSFIQKKWRSSLAAKRWKGAFAAIKVSRSLSPRLESNAAAALPQPDFTFTEKKRKALWRHLHQVVMPEALEQQVSDIENLEAVAHIKHALGRR